MFFESRRTFRRFGRARVQLLVSLSLILALSLLVTCARDNPTQSRSAVTARVVVTPETTDLASAGQSVLLSAQALDDAGLEVSETPVTWRSSDPSVASVSKNGVVIATGEGSVVITAMAGQKTGSARVTVSDPVRRALVALYRATGGENWKNSANWLSDEPVQRWHGVTTAAAGSASGTRPRADAAGAALNLPDNGLSGTIPPELGDLVHLRELDLSNNGLTGSIPPELGNLFRLELLDLSGNRLSGPVPAELGNLFVLKSLQLQDNAGLSGPLPVSFSGLTGLETMDLSGTGLCAPANAGLQRWLGGVTTRRGVANCGAVAEQDRKALIALYETTDGPNWTNKTNWLSGAALDRWYGVSTNAEGRVTALRLSGNRLSGLIPTALGNLAALVSLDLGSNELSGTIPGVLGNLSALVSLDLSDNRLSGPIPTVLLTLHNLQTLDLSGNLFDLEESTDRDALVALYNATDGPNWVRKDNWLSDRPLGEWYGVTTDSTGRVTELNLWTLDEDNRSASNGLAGSIPPELGNLTKLTQLDLRRNRLSGSIPPELGNLTKLKTLSLSINELSGRIPPELGNLTNLIWLWLDRNQLSGRIPPELGSLIKLDQLWLQGNQLSGSIPSELGNLSSLRQLALMSSGLSGSIPAELGRLTNLIWLWLEDNQLSGRIPSELGNLTRLESLSLNGNELSGSLPSELGNLSNLKRLYLFDNTNLSGPLPDSFTHLNIASLFLRGTGLCVPTDAAFQAWLQGIRNKDGVVNCTLATDDRDALVALYNATDGPNWRNGRNWLSDRPLEEWYGVSTNAEGRVDSLKLLGNRLSGSISSELGNLSNLQVLDLQRNTGLSGSIPPELGNLTNLEVLEFDRVPLSGSIPPELGKLRNLRYLGLSRNQLSGQVPSELGNLTNLEVLWLHFNANLSGSLPASLTDLDKLRIVNLRGTGLCAPTDAAFQAWLQGIGSKSGVVNCDPVGPVPGDDRAVLVALYNATDGPNWRNGTNWLSDRPLNEWYGVETNAAGRVTELSLFEVDANNRLVPYGLSGSIPPELGNLSELQALYLHGNELSGRIPPQLGNLSKLVALGLSENDLSGRIPPELGSLSELTHLWLYGNQLTGGVPSSLGNLSKLERLYLHANSGLTGPLPDSFTQLKQLFLLRQDGTGLCVPTDTAFQEWLAGIQVKTGVVNCSTPDSDDRAALIALYNATDGPNWLFSTNWLSDRPLEAWYGVTTDATGRVVRLSLPDNQLSGSIPAQLGNLSKLRDLTLRSNPLSGRIPPELGNLNNLELVDFQGIRFTGSIPPELGNLTNLEHLYITFSPLSGSIPPELGNMTNLKSLNLWGNQLSGRIPSELGNLTNLTWLALSNNQLSGSIPSALGNLSNLQGLLLDGNSALSGPLPASFTGLDRVGRLDLLGTGLCVPTDAALQAWLQGIGTKSGVENCTPSDSDDRAALVALYNATDGPNWTRNDNWLSDRPLGEWYGVTTDSEGRVTQLRFVGADGLSGNGLSGSIPPELGSLSDLTWLSLQHNQLSGSIPSTLGDLNNLRWLQLYNNQLSGSIPSALGNLSNLQELTLYRNQLSGSIPSALGNLGNLQTLALRNNQLSGSIPSALGNLSNLQTLDLQVNTGLTGPLPASLTNLDELNYLSLNGTGLCAPTEAAFQSWLDGIPNKSVVVNCFVEQEDRDALVALYNATDGPNWMNNTNWLSDDPIGNWYGVTTNAEGRVTRLGLYTIVNNTFTSNGLSGRIPPELGRLSKLEVLRLSPNELSGSIPSELSNLSNLTRLELGGNELSGSIPPELGNLSKLTSLGLAVNELSGSIPPELGNLTNLEELYLRNNTGLSGPLPHSFTHLEDLNELLMDGTGLCVPADAEFQAWLDGIQGRKWGVVNCVSPSPDRDALVALYNATDGPNWMNNTNWLSDRPIGEWYGVSVDAEGSVTSLRLFTDSTSSNAFTGNGLSGSIPPELGNLGSLQSLDLRFNRLSGSIPSALGNLGNLQSLDLRFNVLSGSIPSALGNLGNLTHLYLENNQLSGSIPPELGNLGNLTLLSLFYNELSGSIPSALGNLGNLTHLYLDDNQLSGSIPSALGNLGNLTRLILDNNQLSGSIPGNLARLLDLEYLWLDGNADLTGSLPVFFADLLDNLRSLRLEGTGLCAPGTADFQRWLRGIEEKNGVVNCAAQDRSALVALYNATNGPNWERDDNWLSNRPLGEWYGVRTDGIGRVSSLNLRGNQLSGSIPSELGSLNNLESLWLSGGLSGSIPSSLGNLSNLELLYLVSPSSGGLSGSIPSSLGNLGNLELLVLAGRQFGSIPSWMGNLGDLEQLVLHGVSGSIPSALGNLSNLKSLNLAYNDGLIGSIPPALGNLGNLTSMNLFDSSNLSGPLPTSLTRLDLLDTLDIRFTGLCAPRIASFQAWLRGIDDKRGVVNCQ